MVEDKTFSKLKVEDKTSKLWLLFLQVTNLHHDWNFSLTCMVFGSICFLQNLNALYVISATRGLSQNKTKQKTFAKHFFGEGRAG